MATLDFQDVEVKEKISDCIKNSTESIFTTILGSETNYSKDGGNESKGEGVVGIISFIGDVNWLLMLSIPEKSARSMAFKFTGFEVEYDSPDMGDVVGELANVLAGDLVGRLSEAGIKAQMSLPTIMKGQNVQPLLPNGVTSWEMPFKSSEGSFLLKAAGTKQGQEVGRRPGT